MDLSIALVTSQTNSRIRKLFSRNGKSWSLGQELHGTFRYLFYWGPSIITFPRRTEDNQFIQWGVCLTSDPLTFMGQYSHTYGHWKIVRQSEEKREWVSEKVQKSVYIQPWCLCEKVEKCVNIQPWCVCEMVEKCVYIQPCSSSLITGGSNEIWPAVPALCCAVAAAHLRHKSQEPRRTFIVYSYCTLKVFLFTILTIFLFISKILYWAFFSKCYYVPVIDIWLLILGTTVSHCNQIKSKIKLKRIPPTWLHSALSF